LLFRGTILIYAAAGIVIGWRLCNGSYQQDAQIGIAFFADVHLRFSAIKARREISLSPQREIRAEAGFLGRRSRETVAALNPRFPPTIRVSLKASQVLRRPPEVT
jgi:hypothetical protein